MAFINRTDIGISKRIDGTIALRLPVDGRVRTFVLAASDAMGIANAIANAAVLPANPETLGVERVIDVRLKPYDNLGNAHLMLTGDQVGPIHYILAAGVVEALSKAAGAALEFGDDLGRA